MSMMHHHEGEVQGEPEDDGEGPLQLLESPPEVPNVLAFLRRNSCMSMMHHHEHAVEVTVAVGVSEMVFLSLHRRSEREQ